MGNHRFKLAYMIPNAWFYKFMTMNRAAARLRKRAQPPQYYTGTSPDTASGVGATKPSLLLQPNRNSHYYSTTKRKQSKLASPIHPMACDTRFPAFADPAKRSSSRREARQSSARPTSRIVASALASGCRCHAWRSNNHLPPASSEDDDAGFQRSHLYAADIVGKNPSPKGARRLEIGLRPILTKPNYGEKPSPAPARRTFSPGIHRLKARPSSPRIAGRRALAAAEEDKKMKMMKKKKMGRGVSRSFAVVKASSDPERDFRESMVEMIVENGIWSSRDLEELLACYLSLNSGEYHAVIVDVFQQIWLDIAGAAAL